MRVLLYLFGGIVFVTMSLINAGELMRIEWEGSSIHDKIDIVLTWLVVFAIWPIPFILNAIGVIIESDHKNNLD